MIEYLLIHTDRVSGAFSFVTIKCVFPQSAEVSVCSYRVNETAEEDDVVVVPDPSEIPERYLELNPPDA